MKHISGPNSRSEAKSLMAVEVDFFTTVNARSAEAERDESLDLDRAYEKEASSASLLAGVLWRGLMNPGTFVEGLKLLSFPLFKEHARHNPRFVYRYLTRDYLLHGLSVAKRASCFVHHHRRLRGLFTELVIRRILQKEDTEIVEIPEGNNRFIITMGLPKSIDKEGELSINLLMDGENIFILSFTIVPGWVVQAASAEAILVTHVQGKRGAQDKIRHATRSLHDVDPGAILLAALQGMGLAFGVEEIAGVSAERQTCFTEALADNFKHNYDEFFLAQGMTENAMGLFVSPLPIQDKPLTMIKRGHKLRTKEKRAFKRRISDSAQRVLREKQMLASLESSGAGMGD